jgi:predicted nucleic acid-binding protein
MGIAALRSQLHSCKVVALDTNVFVYQLLDHPKYAPLTDLILHAVENGRPRAVTTTVTLAEILTKAEQDANLQAAIDYEAYLTLFPNLTLLPIDVPIAKTAARLRAQFCCKLPDALQMAAALLTQADVFITNDRDLQKRITAPQVILLDDYV